MLTPTIDRTDFTILQLLQKNARLSNKEIAVAIGLAPSSCHERLKRLQASGILRGAHADIDFRAVGLNLEALFFIELAKHERSIVDQFMNETQLIPEVRRAFLVTGRHDMVVHVAVRDMEHLRNLALDHFTNRPVVVRIETSVVFDSRVRYEIDFAELVSTESDVKKSAKKGPKAQNRFAHRAGKPS